MQRAIDLRTVAVTLAAGFAISCVGGQAGTGGPVPPMPPPSVADTTGLIPAGLGSLRQDDIAIHMVVSGLSVRAIPLSDNFIRTLAPDSHRALLAIRESRRAAIDSAARRAGVPSVELWYMTVVAIQQGETQFNPHDIMVTSQARDFRPLTIIPITPGFSDQRLQQRQQAHALYLFDGNLNPNQPLTLTFGTQSGGDWRAVLQRVEGERARIRSRDGDPRGSGVQD